MAHAAGMPVGFRPLVFERVPPSEPFTYRLHSLDQAPQPLDPQPSFYDAEVKHDGLSHQPSTGGRPEGPPLEGGRPQDQPSTGWRPQDPPFEGGRPQDQCEPEETYEDMSNWARFPQADYQRIQTPLDTVIQSLPAIPDHVFSHLYSPFKPDAFAPTPFLCDVPPPFGPRAKKYLAHKNAHPRDDDVVFIGGLEGIDDHEDDDIEVDAEKDHPHRYYIRGSCDHLISVTTLIGAFFEKFDPLVRSEGTFNTKTFKKDQNKPAYKYFGCRSAADIRSKWKQNAHLGTLMHANIEAHLNSEPYVVHNENEKPFGQFRRLFDNKIWRGWKDWQDFRTEWSVFDEETMLCGQIDYVGMLDEKSGSVILVDWKRTEQITDCNFGRFTGATEGINGYGVCQHLDNCNWIKYSLQLNVYQWILEKNYGLKVAKSLILQFHPKNRDNMPGVLKVPNMQPLIHQIMACRKVALARNLK